MLRDWVVPRPALVVSGLITAAFLAGLAAAFLLDGLGAALAIGMGAMGAVRPALLGRPGLAALLTIPVAMAGAVAVALRGDALAGALFVALCCLMVVPASAISGGLLSMLPTVASVLVAAPGTFAVAPTLLWMLAGAALTIALSALVPTPPAAPPTPADTVWLHGAAMALAAGGVVFAVVALDVRHGYWVALTLTVLLRPVHRETRRAAAQRVVGTLGGTLLALVLVGLAPWWGIAIALVGCMVLMTAYALMSDTTRQVLFMTPAVVLLGSAGHVGVTAAERVVATALGCLLAGALALLLSWYENRHRSRKDADEV